MKKITMGDVGKGFRRAARRTPDRVRIAILGLIFAITALVPALGLALAAGAGTSALTAQIWRIPSEHGAAVAVFLTVFALTFRFIMPLLKMAWAKFEEWDQEISMTKHVKE